MVTEESAEKLVESKNKFTSNNNVDDDRQKYTQFMSWSWISF